MEKQEMQIVETSAKTASMLQIGAVEDIYIIALMNFSTQWSCVEISFDYKNWYAVNPQVGRTCDYTPAQAAQCFREGKFVPIAKTNCGRNNEVWLGFKNASGQHGRLAQNDPYTFYADCKEKGKVLLFDD